MKWVSVKEKLPKPNRRCLIWVKTPYGGFFTGAFYLENFDEWVLDTGYSQDEYEVTHWAEIEPPEEGGKR